MIIDVVVGTLVIIGGLFTLIGSFGLARFPDFYTRLHGPTKATTLGAGALIIASVTHFTAQEGVVNLPEVLVILFLFLTAPVSAHLVARAALVREVDSVTAGSSTAHGHRRPDHEPGADQPARTDVEPTPPADAPASESTDAGPDR
jgi:multicomponent K+:H+ antiporter subunit G